MQNNAKVELCVIKEVRREPLNYFGLLWSTLNYLPNFPLSKAGQHTLTVYQKTSVIIILQMLSCRNHIAIHCC